MSRWYRTIALTTALGLLATLTIVVNTISRPEPAAAFDGTAAFNDTAVGEGALFVVPDGNGGWKGALAGADIGGDFPFAYLFAATIDANGQTTKTLVWQNSVEFGGFIDSIATNSNGDFVAVTVDNFDQRTLRGFTAAGAPLFSVGLAEGFYELGWMSDSMFYAAQRTFRRGDTPASAEVRTFNADGSPIAGPFAVTAGDIWQTAPGDEDFVVLAGPNEVDGTPTLTRYSAGGTVVDAVTAPANTRFVHPRGRLGWFLRAGTGLVGSGWQMYTVDTELAVSEPIQYTSPDSTLSSYQFATGPDGSGILKVPTRSFTEAIVQHVSPNGQPFGDPLTVDVETGDLFFNFCCSFNVGGLGQTLTGFTTGTAARNGRDLNLYVVDTSIDAVRAVIDIEQDFDNEILFVDPTPAGAFYERIQFISDNSSAPADDPIVDVEWTWERTDIDDGADPVDLGGGTEQSPFMHFVLPPGELQDWEATLKVTTRSGLEAETTEEFYLAGPAANGFDVVVFDDPDITYPDTLRGGAYPPSGHTDTVVFEHRSVQHTGGSASTLAVTRVEWSDPSAVTVTSVTGSPDVSPLAPYEPILNWEASTPTPDRTESRHEFEPLAAGEFEVTFTADIIDPVFSQFERQVTATQTVFLIGADVAAGADGFDDPENPGTVAAGLPGEILIEYANDGFGDGEVELTLPEIDGYELSIPEDQQTFTVAPEETATVALTVTTNRAGPVVIPIEAKVTDTATGQLSDPADIVLQVNVIAGFEWEAPPRLERPEGREIPNLPDDDTFEDQALVQHVDYPIDVTLTDVADCNTEIIWDVVELVDHDDDSTTPPIREELEIDPEIVDAALCEFRFRFANEGDFEIDVTIDDEQVAFGGVTVEDVLYVIIGDSVASGEGNPDIPLSIQGDDEWVNAECRRSINSGAAQAAYDLEEESDFSTVTLVHVACSGATIRNGVLGQQASTSGDDSFVGPPVPGQLDIVEFLIGDRDVDVTVLQAGANDLLFGPVLLFCIENGEPRTDCQDMGFSENTDWEFNNVQFSEREGNPERLYPYEGLLCADYGAGTTRFRTYPVSANANINQGREWDVVINSEETDFSDRLPIGSEDLGPGASGDEEHTPEEIVGDTTCTEVASTSTTDGFAIVLDDDDRFNGPGSALEQNHYNLYTSEGTEAVDVNPRDIDSEDLTWVSATPDTLDERMAVLVNGDPDDPDSGLAYGYDLLDAELDRIGIDPSTVLAVEYYNPLSGPVVETSRGPTSTCQRIPDIPLIETGNEAIDAQAAASGVILGTEADWAITDILNPLNREFRAASERHEWNFIGGVANAFQGNGYCSDASTSMIVTIGDALNNGTPSTGPMHPNARGHQVISEFILGYVNDNILEDPTVFDELDPTVAGQIARAAEAGSRVVELILRTATDNGFAAAETAVPFQVGDWVVVGSGREEVVFNGEVVVGGPELVEVVAVDATSITVEPALEYAHRPGEQVVTVPDRTRRGVEDPFVEAVGDDDAGYALVQADGTVTEYGPIADIASLTTEGNTVVDVDTIPGGDILWALLSDGTVITTNGSGVRATVPTSLATGEAPGAVVGHPDGSSYWVITDTGRVIAFGNAPAITGIDDLPLNGPILDGTATASGNGILVAAFDGGVFALGDAVFAGSMGATPLNQPVVGIAADPDGDGYWLWAGDGGVFAFDADFNGSVPGVLAPGVSLNAPVIGGVPWGNGYAMVASDGGVFVFSNRSFLGSLGGSQVTSPIVGLAPLGGSG
ncbi:MAG: hypothetical protein AAGA99_01845 [Actinomycetota bacterium]